MGGELHIAIACPGCGRGTSVANVAIRHAVELAKYFSVTLISDTTPEFRLSDIDVVALAPKRYDYLRRLCHVPNAWSLARDAARSLDSLCRRTHVDLLVCHGHAFAAIAACRVKRDHGVPYALVTHGDIFYRPPGTYDLWLTQFYKMVTKPAYRRADLVFALSPRMAEYAVRGGASEAKVRVIPNGIDPQEIGLELPSTEPTSPSNVSQSAPLKLLYVGRLSVEKGIAVLAEACATLRDAEVPFEFSVIGEGRLAGLFDKLDRSSIRMWGSVPRRNLGEHYRAADVVCVPSLDDPCPLVVLEALIAGKPVIGSDVGGIPAMVCHESNGLIVPPANVERLAGAICLLASDRELLRRLSARAQPSVYPGLLWETIGRRLRDNIVEFCELRGRG